MRFRLQVETAVVRLFTKVIGGNHHRVALGNRSGLISNSLYYMPKPCR